MLDFLLCSLLVLLSYAHGAIVINYGSQNSGQSHKNTVTKAPPPAPAHSDGTKAIGQSSSGGKRLTSNLTCFTCQFDQTAYADSSNDRSCLFKKDFAVPRVAADNVEECNQRQRTCKVEVVFYWGVLATLTRGCDTDCQPGCEHRGWGVDMRTCRWCCSKPNLCNSWQDEVFNSAKPKHKFENLLTSTCLLYCMTLLMQIQRLLM